MQPNEVKWHLMIASCYRRSGNYHKALDTYKASLRITLLRIQFLILTTISFQTVRPPQIPGKYRVPEISGQDLERLGLERGWRVRHGAEEGGEGQRAQREQDIQLKVRIEDWVQQNQQLKEWICGEQIV